MGSRLRTQLLNVCSPYLLGYYGAAAGTLMGAALGNDISAEEAKQYSDRLAQGKYLMIIEGSKEELALAESVLKNKKLKIGTFIKTVSTDRVKKWWNLVSLIRYFAIVREM
jgi:hypothetical protein